MMATFSYFGQQNSAMNPKLIHRGSVNIALRILSITQAKYLSIQLGNKII